jgi:hypothetical protein
MIHAPRITFCTLALAGWIGLGGLSPAAAAEISLQPTERGAKVLIDGALFTEYRTDIGTKPILWPIVGPTGAEMTRNYPMKDVEGEKQDHYHQQSFWFTYGEVNGLDFWAEPRSYKQGKTPADKKFGTIVQREFTAASANSASGESAGKNSVSFVTRNDWIDSATGSKQLEDERHFRFTTADGARIIDFSVTLKASSGKVEFGDTKEGALGIRVPTVLDVVGKHGGRIESSEDQTDEAAWGKPARWVDYSGIIEGEPVGIAILNHPASFRYPTRWHVRTYGLFAANPFGLHDFDKSATQPGGYALQAGETISLHYRLIFHRGDTKQARLPKAFEAYAKSAP